MTDADDRWWITKAEAAARLGISVNTLRVMIANGQITPVVLGRREVIRLDDIDALVPGADMSGELDALVDHLADRVAERVLAELDRRETVMPAEREALTLDEAADALGVSERTVRRLITKGRLPSVRIGTRRLVPIDAVRSMAVTGVDEVAT